MIENNTSKKIQISLHSTRFETGFQSPLAPAPKDADTEPQEMRLVTEATLSREGERYIISYNEGELGGLDNSQTSLIFDADSLDTLTMIRRGAVRVTMVFSPGLRHTCKYINPVMPFDMTIMTRTVENRLAENGTLKVDYITELPGANIARTLLKFKMTFQEK